MRPKLEVIDIGTTHCKSCANTERLLLIKTNLPGTKSVNVLVCRKCDRFRVR